jgi:hypothetical protein
MTKFGGDFGLNEKSRWVLIFSKILIQKKKNEKKKKKKKKNKKKHSN